MFVIIGSAVLRRFLVVKRANFEHSSRVPFASRRYSGAAAYASQRFSYRDQGVEKSLKAESVAFLSPGIFLRLPLSDRIRVRFEARVGLMDLWLPHSEAFAVIEHQMNQRTRFWAGWRWLRFNAAVGGSLEGDDDLRLDFSLSGPTAGVSLSF